MLSVARNAAFNDLSSAWREKRLCDDLSKLIAWREKQVVPVDRLASAVASIADDLRERTQRTFGLPEGEHVEFELVTDKPWSGFNYYLGDLRSRVAINVDLPVLSPVTWRSG